MQLIPINLPFLRCMQSQLEIAFSLLMGGLQTAHLAQHRLTFERVKAFFNTRHLLEVSLREPSS